MRISDWSADVCSSDLIVRNALDHGIETPAERRAAGKRENGRLTVSARQSGNQIIIEFLDDGRGIDTDKLVRRLVENSARTQRELHELTELQRLDLIFEPGLTTKDEVTSVRSEEHTSELQSLMRLSSAVFC